MPVYTFRFGSQFVGQDASVYDSDTRVEVEGSPFSIEADGTGAVATATLDAGEYYADASGGLLTVGGSRTTGTLDIPASLAAPGVGVVLDGASLFFEINDGAELDPTGQTILTWDTQPDGYEGSETQIQLEPGLYHVGVYIEVTRPAEDRSATVGISSQNSIQSNVGPLLISAAGGDVASSTIEASGIAIVRGGGDTSIQVSLNLDVLDSEPSPADVEIGYAALTITPIG